MSLKFCQFVFFSAALLSIPVPNLSEPEKIWTHLGGKTIHPIIKKNVPPSSAGMSKSASEKDYAYAIFNRPQDGPMRRSIEKEFKIKFLGVHDSE